MSAAVTRVLSATSTAARERHRVVRGEQDMGIAREDRHAIAGLDAEGLERAGELQRPLQEPGVGEADFAVHHPHAVPEHPRCAVQERRWCQRLEAELGRHRSDPYSVLTTCPPSTTSVAPVMNSEASEASSSSGPSRCSGFPSRRCGTRLISVWPASLAKNSRLMSVSM